MHGTSFKKKSALTHSPSLLAFRQDIYFSGGLFQRQSVSMVMAAHRSGRGRVREGGGRERERDDSSLSATAVHLLTHIYAADAYSYRRLIHSLLLPLSSTSHCWFLVALFALSAHTDSHSLNVPPSVYQLPYVLQSFKLGHLCHMTRKLSNLYNNESIKAENSSTIINVPIYKVVVVVIKIHLIRLKWVCRSDLEEDAEFLWQVIPQCGCFNLFLS